MLFAIDPDVKRKDSETEMEYIQRMCDSRLINTFTWKELTEVINETLNLNYSESYYRKNYTKGNFITLPTTYSTTTNASSDTYTMAETLNAIKDRIETATDECSGECGSCDNLPDCLYAWNEEIQNQKDELKDTLLEIKKETVKLSDERIQNGVYIRRLAREETIKEIAHHYAELMDKRKKLPAPSIILTHKEDAPVSEGILLLSDWHYGMECDNPWNKFNPEICRIRVRKLLDKVINIISQHQLSRMTVMNLSDLIAGRIHTQIRIESRFDVITQTMEVSEILAEFLNELSTYCRISYYDCLDNHSRLEPNKHDSMDLESLVRIIPWYLKERLNSNPRIFICDNEFGADIITCEVLGHNVIGVHGDNDKPTNALDRLSLMTHRHYDMLCTAHLHHFSADEQHQSVVVSNSSLMGVDRYAEKLRLTSDPSQTLVIATPDNVCECIYRIVLK